MFKQKVEGNVSKHIEDKDCQICKDRKLGCQDRCKYNEIKRNKFKKARENEKEHKLNSNGLYNHLAKKSKKINKSQKGNMQ